MKQPFSQECSAAIPSGPKVSPQSPPRQQPQILVKKKRPIIRFQTRSLKLRLARMTSLPTGTEPSEPTMRRCGGPRMPGHRPGQVMITGLDEGHSSAKCDREEQSYTDASWGWVTCSLCGSQGGPSLLSLCPFGSCAAVCVFFTVTLAYACLGHLCIEKRRC